MRVRVNITSYYSFQTIERAEPESLYNVIDLPEEKVNEILNVTSQFVEIRKFLRQELKKVKNAKSV